MKETNIVIGKKTKTETVTGTVIVVVIGTVVEIEIVIVVEIVIGIVMVVIMSCPRKVVVKTFVIGCGSSLQERALVHT